MTVDAGDDHTPRAYLYLKRGQGRAEEDVVESNYRLDELVERPVIRDEYRRCYYVFADWEDFWAWQDRRPLEERCYNEVVIGPTPQRLKFDIDAPVENIDAITLREAQEFAERGTRRSQPGRSDNPKAGEGGPAPAPSPTDPAAVDETPASSIEAGLAELYAELFTGGGQPAAADETPASSIEAGLAELYAELIAGEQPAAADETPASSIEAGLAELYAELFAGEQPGAEGFPTERPPLEGAAAPPPNAGGAAAQEGGASGTTKAAGGGQQLLEDERQTKVDLLLRGLIESILDELHSAYFGLDKIEAGFEDVIVTDASGPEGGGGHKYSFHIIVAPLAVANNVEAKGFTSRVCERLPAAIRKLVDPQVNARLQNFRLVGSRKPGSRRVKTLTTRYGTAHAPREATTIRVQRGGSIPVLTRLYTEETEDFCEIRLLNETRDPRLYAPDYPDEDIQAVLAVVQRAGAADDHEFLRPLGNLLLFRRRAPGFCRLCSRVHDKDNTLMVNAVPLEGGVREEGGGRFPHKVIERCRRNKTASRDLGVVDLVTPRSTAEAPSRDKPEEAPLERFIAAVNAGLVDVHRANATELENLPNRHVYSAAEMRDYELCPTLVVKGQMKLGKTKALRRYIDKYFPNRPAALQDAVVRIVTFRQTFSKNLQRGNFPDFKLYNEVRGDLDHYQHPRLIVQVESLSRLRVFEQTDPVDLLILDEVESVLAQFGSGLHRHFNAAFAVFQWMLATAAHVVCLDANAGDRTLHALQLLRAGRPVTFHWNTIPVAKGDKYFFTKSEPEWIDHLHDRLQKNQRVVIPTNSLNQARALAATVLERHPGKKVRLYSSATPPSEKMRHFGDVHKYWSDVDVLIYTPTVSAGVSYELEHFDVLFGFFVNKSCDVETCRQMLARIRKLSTREHYICLNGGGGGWAPCTVNEIRRLVLDRRSSLFRSVSHLMAYEYGPHGELIFHDSPYFHLWLENTRVENLSKNSFVPRFIAQVADTGATVALLEKLPGAEARLADLRAGLLATKRELTEAECEAIAGAPDLQPEEVERVREKIIDQLDVPQADLLGYAKAALRDTYRWHGSPIDAAFVAKYRHKKVAQVYLNLCRITAKTSLLAALRDIQEEERGDFQSLLLMTTSPAAGDRSLLDQHDLSHRYTFQGHHLALWLLLRMCGFRCLLDPAVVRAEELYERLRAGEKGLLDRLEAIAFEFEDLRTPSKESVAGELDPTFYLRKAMSVVNGVLRRMYGIQVKQVSSQQGGVGLYRLSRTKVGQLFDIVDANAPPPEKTKPQVLSHLTPAPSD